MIIMLGLAVSVAVFFVSFWFFSKANNTHPLQTEQAQASAPKTFMISSKDIETISGDNLLSTQLDLARAYLETDRKNLAKNILNNVIQQGSEEQRQEAQRLLGSLQTVV